MKRLRMRQVRACEDLALAQDMHGMISTEARFYKAQVRTHKIGREELQDRLGRYMQEKAVKESRLRTVETILQKDRLGKSQETAESSNAGPRPSGSPTSSKGQACAGRIYLEVPYCDKDDAKALGAQWDPKKKKWYAQSQDARRKLHQWPEAEFEDRN